MKMRSALTDLSLSDFIESPDVIEFMTNETDPLRTYLTRWPEARVGKVLGMGLAAVYIPEEHVQEIIDDPEIHLRINLSTILSPMGRAELENSGILAVQGNLHLDLHGQGVLIGFVDSGIDYTQSAFQYADHTTRIKYIWDQTVSGHPPASYEYGSEYDEDAINAALLSEDPQKVVAHTDETGHGTFLARVSTGNEYGRSPEACIIAVKLRPANRFLLRMFLVPPEMPPIYASTDLMLGVQYILEKAEELSLPVAICIGLGSNQSSHTGRTLLDNYLINAGMKTGVAICVAAGNEAIAGHHFQGSIASTDEDVDMKIRCESMTQSDGISLGIFTSGMDRVSVSVISPLGELVDGTYTKSSTAISHELVMENATVHIEYSFPISSSSSQFTFVRIKWPTEGLWTVRLHGDIILDGTVHAWLANTGQANPNIRFVSQESHCTITEPGVATGVITVGAYTALTRTLFAESSWGPTKLPALSPDLCAPGVNVAGLFPSGPGVMSGTSVAAAITTGACALLLEWGIVEGMDMSFNTSTIKTHLIRGCAKDANLRYPNEQWGYGRLDLMNTFMKMR
jgi:subtilisin family serine protease